MKTILLWGIFFYSFIIYAELPISQVIEAVKYSGTIWKESHLDQISPKEIENYDDSFAFQCLSDWTNTPDLLRVKHDDNRLDMQAGILTFNFLLPRLKQVANEKNWLEYEKIYKITVLCNLSFFRASVNGELLGEIKNIIIAFPPPTEVRQKLNDFLGLLLNQCEQNFAVESDNQENLKILAKIGLINMLIIQNKIAKEAGYSPDGFHLKEEFFFKQFSSLKESPLYQLKAALALNEESWIYILTIKDHTQKNGIVFLVYSKPFSDYLAESPVAPYTGLDFSLSKMSNPETPYPTVSIYNKRIPSSFTWDDGHKMKIAVE